MMVRSESSGPPTRTRKSSALQDYTLHLKHFIDSTNIEYIEQATAATVERYRDWMQEQGYSAKTRTHALSRCCPCSKRNNVKTKFSITTDLPRVEEEPAVPYTGEEIKKLFSAMGDEEKIRYEFFLGTGCRDKEVTFCACLREAAAHDLIMTECFRHLGS